MLHFFWNELIAFVTCLWKNSVLGCPNGSWVIPQTSMWFEAPKTDPNEMWKTQCHLHTKLHHPQITIFMSCINPEPEVYGKSHIHHELWGDMVPQIPIEVKAFWLWCARTSSPTSAGWPDTMRLATRAGNLSNSEVSLKKILGSCSTFFVLSGNRT